MFSLKKLAVAFCLAFQIFVLNGNATPLFIGNCDQNEKKSGLISDENVHHFGLDLTGNNFAFQKSTVFDLDISSNDFNFEICSAFFLILKFECDEMTDSLPSLEIRNGHLHQKSPGLAGR